MIEITYNPYDCDNYFKKDVQVRMSLEGHPEHIAYYTQMFRQFLVGFGFGENLVDEYILDIGDIESHIDEKVEEVTGDIEKPVGPVLVEEKWTKDDEIEAINSSIKLTPIDDSMKEKLAVEFNIDTNTVVDTEKPPISSETVIRGMDVPLVIADEVTFTKTPIPKKAPAYDFFVDGWNLDEWKIEFKKWLTERDLLEEYKRYNEEATESLKDTTWIKFEDICEVEHFISRAFPWEAYPLVDWFPHDNDWHKHVENLKNGH